MKTYFALFLITLSFIVFAQSQAQDPIQDALKELANVQMNALQTEDLAALRASLHSDSPLLEATMSQIPDIFEALDLSYELLEFVYIASETDYAYARVRQNTKRLAGVPFRDNELDQIWVFKQEGTDWKVWTSTMLEIKLLDE